MFVASSQLVGVALCYSFEVNSLHESRASARRGLDIFSFIIFCSCLSFEPLQRTKYFTILGQLGNFLSQLGVLITRVRVKIHIVTVEDDGVIY